MRNAPSGIQAALARKHGLATNAELAAAGFSAARIQTQLRAGTIVQLSRGVYALPELAAAAVGDPAREHALAVAAAIRRVGPEVVASHQSAAIIHGLAMMSRPVPAEVTLTRSAQASRSRSERAGVHVHNAELLGGHLTSAFGVPLTNVARTVVDLGRTILLTEGVVVADSALHYRKTTRSELNAVNLACARWPGARRARRVLSFADPRSESVLESIARAAFHEHGLPAPILQAWVGGEYGVVGRADFFWPEHGTIAEADGALKYTRPGRARSQLNRDELLREAGFEVVHFSWHQIVKVPWQVVASIQAAFRRADAARARG
jgi:Transcriptional regulator, AbiEi antitoxin/Protein of unknown function (DUF559)